MCKELLGDINKKNLTFAVIAVFVFIFLTDWLIHGNLLVGMYDATSEAWRPKESAKDFMLWMIIGQFLIAKFFTVIFARGYEGKGWCEGLRYGILVAFLFSGFSFIWYAVTPIPMALLWCWIGGNFFQAIGSGIIAGLIYKK